MQKTFLILFLLLMNNDFLLTQNYSSFPIGQSWIFPDARSLGLAGAGTVSLGAPGAVLLNPAALTLVNQSITTNFSLNLHKLEERRSYPLYDRFDSFLLYSTYVLNDNWYTQPQGGVAVRIPWSVIPRLTIALGAFPEIDYHYRYREEVRENIFGDQLIAYNRIEANGLLRRYSIALAGNVPGANKLSVGIQAGMLKGSVDYVSEINYYESQQRVVLNQQQRNLQNTPLILSLGTIYRLTERISVGADVSLPYSLDYSHHIPQQMILSETIEYPARMNAGFEFRAQQELQARLNVDVGYEFWSRTQYSSQIGGNIPTTQEFSDVFYLKTGIEHIFFNKLPFRVGAQYRTSYLSRGTTRTLLAAGAGFMGSNWRVDISGAFNKAVYRWEDLFDDRLYVTDPNFQSRIDLDNVEETYFFALLSLEYFLDFGW